MSQEAERIRQCIERKPKEKLTALLHHITPDTLREAYHGLKPRAAPGADGMTWEEYGQGLEQRLLDLHRCVHTGAYWATPSRRVNIPKPDGGTRPLGVAALEDKIIQKAAVDNILTPIYEAEFLGFSYGFRPGRGAHNALDALAVGIERRKINWILDADVSKFFDRIDRAKLLELLGERIGDKRLLRLIRKWFISEHSDIEEDFLVGGAADGCRRRIEEDLIEDILPPSVTRIVRQRGCSSSNLCEAMRRQF